MLFDLADADRFKVFDRFAESQNAGQTYYAVPIGVGIVRLLKLHRANA